MKFLINMMLAYLGDIDTATALVNRYKRTFLGCTLVLSGEPLFLPASIVHPFDVFCDMGGTDEYAEHICLCLLYRFDRRFSHRSQGPVN